VFKKPTKATRPNSDFTDSVGSWVDDERDRKKRKEKKRKMVLSS
jgi:hypothetical protein